MIPSKGPRSSPFSLDEIGNNQDDTLGIALHDDDAIIHPGKSANRVFDFAELDPQSANLHLVILPAQILDVAIRQPAGDVARPVNPFARDTDRVIGEFLRCQPRGLLR